MIQKTEVTCGVTWVAIPEADLRLLCGCPADVVKHLMKRGLIQSVEVGGVAFETGPNAILLSDVAVQNGDFANLAEFPVLQMFYRQGLILPGHPNNTGEKPLLLGTEEQVSAQARYIFRGNYGLASQKELEGAGVRESRARELMRMKLKFAFGSIRETEDLLETRIIGDDPIEIRQGVRICRRGLNEYEIEYSGESCTVDLNLTGTQAYQPAYKLGYHSIGREYFSVVHLGEGDGWDVDRPCMSSLITFQGRLYLIDVGPHILHSLIALGISVNEIAGVFHTHAHDDHFAGLTSLMTSARRIKLFATPLVRASVLKKLSALTSIDESRFEHYFRFVDLKAGAWNNVDGLEVKPTFSPHPVETTVLFFRTLSEAGVKTYAHLADTISLSVLEGMITDDDEAPGISRELFDTVRETYATAVDVKKVDVGGGMIHGRAEDFAEDTSERILLSHVARPLTSAEKEIGSNASFGLQDVLVPSRQDHARNRAHRYLSAYFRSAAPHQLALLLNCSIRSLHAGTILLRRGRPNRNIYLLLTGVVEYVETERELQNLLSAGALIGDISGLTETAVKGTYRAASQVQVLEIPQNLYRAFVVSCDLLRDIRKMHAMRQFLKRTDLFGGVGSFPLQQSIAQAMETLDVADGETLQIERERQVVVVVRGTLRLMVRKRAIETIAQGELYGEERLFRERKPIFTAAATQASRLYCIPTAVVEDIPSVRWKLFEVYNRRLRSYAESQGPGE